MTIILACVAFLVIVWKLQPVVCGNDLVLDAVANRISSRVKKETSR